MIDRIPRMRRFSPALTIRALSRHYTAQSLLIRPPPHSCLNPRHARSLTSTIHLTQLRAYSTPTTTSPPQSLPSEPSTPNSITSPPPPPPARRRPLALPLIYAGLFLLIGHTFGTTAVSIIAPAPAPIPFSPADQQQTSQIQALAATLPVVKSLSSDPAWRSWPAYSGMSAAHLRNRLTSGALAGSRGLGAYQQIFYNAGTGEWVTVVWIGEAMAGWPGVAHGGVLATLLDESLGRCAIAGFAEKTAVTANLEVDYLRMVRTRAFSVLRVRRMEGNGGEPKVERKAWIEASLEDLGGNVLVKAKGLFVVPRNLALPTLPDEVF